MQETGEGAAHGEAPPRGDASHDGGGDVAALGTILGVWAHPDDETYLSGGIMAAATAAGQRVVCVTATAGERGTPDPEAWPPDRLAAVRRRELAQALDILGVGEHHWLGYADGGCDRVDDREAVDRIGEVVAAVEPDTILTFGPDGMTGHSDHKAAARWALAAAGRAARAPRVLQAVKDTGWVERFASLHLEFEVFEPGYPVALDPADLTLHVELPDDLVARKLAALQAQQSQTAGIISALGTEDYRRWIRTESFVDAAQRPADAGG